ncbi:unnamed protein product [Lampetra planeri]
MFWRPRIRRDKSFASRGRWPEDADKAPPRVRGDNASELEGNYAGVAISKPSLTSVASFASESALRPSLGLARTPVETTAAGGRLATRPKEVLANAERRVVSRRVKARLVLSPRVALRVSALPLAATPPGLEEHDG